MYIVCFLGNRLYIFHRQDHHYWNDNSGFLFRILRTSGAHQAIRVRRCDAFPPQQMVAHDHCGSRFLGNIVHVLPCVLHRRRHVVLMLL